MIVLLFKLNSTYFHTAFVCNLLLLIVLAFFLGGGILFIVDNVIRNIPFLSGGLICSLFITIILVFGKLIEFSCSYNLFYLLKYFSLRIKIFSKQTYGKIVHSLDLEYNVEIKLKWIKIGNISCQIPALSIISVQ